MMSGAKTMRSVVLLLALLALLAGAFPALAGETGAPASKPLIPVGELIAHFYYTPGCPLCEPAKKAVAAAEVKYAGRVRIVRHSLSAGEKQYAAFIAALDHYGRKDTPNLVVFVGDQCVGGGEAIAKELDHTLAKLLAAGAVTPEFSKFGVDEGEAQVARDRRVSLWLVISAGFVDGFNPCAFATVILFVSMLSSVGRERRTILAVGISFILSVFLTYILIGAAFYEVMRFFENNAYLQYAGLAIKWLSLALVLAAGVLSLVDAWRAFRSGGKEKMLLVLPDGLKDRIRKRLRVTAHSGSLIGGAFVSGFIISFLEAACTGQTYIPVITGLVSDQLTAAQGYAWLLLYNVMFIIPLLAVFIGVYLGYTSDQIGNAMRKQVWITKLALAGIFLLIAVWLGSMLLPTLPFKRPAEPAETSAPVKPTTPVEHAPGNADGVDR